jgi:glycosyltransferase involved in cell wall biosynthesis
LPGPPPAGLDALTAASVDSVRVALVTSHFPPWTGGLERHVANLARRLSSRGIEVEVLVPAPASAVEDLSESPRVLVRRFGSGVGGQRHALAPGLWRHLRRAAARYDLIHAHNYHALPALAAACSPARPLVLTPHYHGSGHSPISRMLHAVYRPAGRSILARASEVICVSRAEASLVAADFPECASRISVIHNGIDFDALAAAEPLAVEGRLILAAGRLERYKNVELILEAMPLLPAEWHLRVIGRGPDRSRLEQRSRALRLTERVAWSDPVGEDALWRWLKSASVCVSMSAHEAFGLGVAEAISAGAGVVASDIPAHREVARLLGPERATLVARESSPAALAAAIMQSGRALGPPPAPERLSWERMATRTLRVYERVLEAGARREGMPGLKSATVGSRR